MKIVNNKKEAIQELQRISNRTNLENNNKINLIVAEILDEVKTHGDIAVERYTQKFDGFNPNPMQVSKDLFYLIIFYLVSPVFFVVQGLILGMLYFTSIEQSFLSEEK